MCAMNAMNKLRRWMLAGVLLTSIVGCGENGSGAITTESRSVSGFSEVEVRGVIHLELTLGGAQTLSLTGDDNLLPLIETEVVGDKLIIKSTRNISPSAPLVAKVEAPDVTLVEGSGAADLRISHVDNRELAVELSGVGKLHVEGKTEKLRLRVSGAGSANAQQLAAADIVVDVSGAGTVDVGAPKKLAVEISGAGTVRYEGDPTIEKNLSGAATVMKR